MAKFKHKMFLHVFGPVPLLQSILLIFINLTSLGDNMGFLVAQLVKNLPAMQDMWV